MHKAGSPETEGSDDGVTHGTPTLVIVPIVRGRKSLQDESIRRSPEARLEEAVGLAAAIELDIRHSGVVQLGERRPATLFGKGKVEELGAIVKAEEVDLVVVDHVLSPVQQRNLEKAWDAKVLDRTGLILEIFGERARTKEGRLQVELAHLTWQKSRLVRSWTHLERQRGSLGFIGGPGETQIEADRRIIQERITKLEKELEQVRRTRTLHRAQRRKVPHPIVALVGYTNAGKSTLFNRLTSADVMAENLLFATLDPTLRRIPLPHGLEVMLSDTVGFISELPTHLVAAFRATLEEVLEADLILHVRDISHEDSAAQAEDVKDTLERLGVSAKDGARIVEVWNKIDRLEPENREGLLARTRSGEEAIAVSALSGEGVDVLLTRIEDLLTSEREIMLLHLPATDGEGLAWLYRSTEVLSREEHDGMMDLRVRVPDKALDTFRQRFAGQIDPV
ncbi:GTP-binding protein HflX [Breoghania corrubedonensis]|uniref:GTPase HflX n=1 Tax=Breoghania corrubedonensis TaxID=665038 RepID=A0A2T5V920_9HYPH|nr:GTP-binding protein HflX [Breoghania corrubedonensis]